jgi:hypothetical protein
LNSLISGSIRDVEPLQVSNGIPLGIPIGMRLQFLRGFKKSMRRVCSDHHSFAVDPNSGDPDDHGIIVKIVKLVAS